MFDSDTPYINHLNRLTPDDIYDGLLGYGLFCDKLPPILTSAPFLAYCKNTTNTSSKKQGHEWIRFTYRRNIGRLREFGIPNPFAYEHLVKTISDNWRDLTQFFAKHTAIQKYCSSRIHIRKLNGTRAIFKMNYDTPTPDIRLYPAALLGKRYAVSCDVNQFFPSIYTHALDWALIEKDQAKKNAQGKICQWSHDIDRFSQLCTNRQTHGLLIGPHASNLLSEIILARVDEALLMKNADYRFLHHIDDYTCYTESYEEAERFILDITEALKAYNLSLNEKKTSITKLPTTLSTDWVRRLQHLRPQSEMIKLNDVVHYFDEAIGMTLELNNNCAIILYAMKVLARLTERMENRAKHYFFDMSTHLLFLHPYLIPHAEEQIFQCGMSLLDITSFIPILYSQAIDQRDNLTCAYSCYFAAKYNGTLPSTLCDDALRSDDCLFKLFAYWFFKKKNDAEGVKALYDDALALSQNAEDFDSNWLFVYEALNVNDLDGKWKALKKAGVSFLSNST